MDDRHSREYPARPIVGVGAVIITTPRDAPFLGSAYPSPSPFGVVLVKRRFEPLAGRWSLPGGTVEVGETLEQAAAREIVEETGLQVSIGPVVEVFDRIVREPDGRVRFHFVLVDYLCSTIGGHLQPASDVEDAALAHPEGLDAFNLTDKALAVIRRAFEMAKDEG